MRRTKRAKRISPDQRRELILNVAIKLSIEIGYTKITRDGIAERAKISGSLVNMYFPTMRHIVFAVMDAAIERGIVEIIAQGLILNDPHTVKITDATKQKVLSYISNLM